MIIIIIIIIIQCSVTVLQCDTPLVFEMNEAVFKCNIYLEENLQFVLFS
jgi:hypothetical protein